MRENILVIDGHPDPARQRLGHALAEAYCDGARATGKEVRLITVAESEFPLLRTAADFATPPVSPAILRAREDLLWAHHIVLIFPLWLGGAPALLRGFLEQVARASFVAETDGRGIRPKLKGKSARVIVTMGMPALIYRLMFHEHGVRNIMQGVLGFGGIAPIRRTLFGAIEAPGGNQKKQLAVVHRLGRDGA
ncbi:MAG: NAD(P)H-dependent oxidoreductase [Pseudomonadota bacterium]